jgi:hypothetical protein
MRTPREPDQVTVIDKEINGFGDLPELARFAAKTFGGEAAWFRGHADASWALVPSVFREYEPARESNLAIRFMEMAPALKSNCPARSDVPAWACLMRHYELPTRLLDWTSSILVACFFATADAAVPLDVPAAIWALGPTNLNKRSVDRPVIFSMGDRQMDHFLLPIVGLRADGDPCVVAALPPHVDLRMALQRSNFTVHNSAKPLEDLFAGATIRMTINSAAKVKLKKDLALLGIDRVSLFPDLVNLAATLGGMRFSGFNPPKESER